MFRPAHLNAPMKQRNSDSHQIRLGRRGRSPGPGSVGKVCSTFSLHFFAAPLLFLCLLLPKSEISTFLFIVEINFHPVTLNLTRRKAAFLSPPPREGGEKKQTENIGLFSPVTEKRKLGYARRREWNKTYIGAEKSA